MNGVGLLQSMRFGRLSKRFEESSRSHLLSAVESMTGRAIPSAARTRIARGADEIDLVNSGLEETMIRAYDEIREMMRSRATLSDLRTAALVTAIDRIAICYQQLGIFP